MATRVPPITARGDHKELIGTSNNDDLLIAGVARALAGGDVLIDLLEGNDTLAISGTTSARAMGTVDIQAGDGDNTIAMARGLQAQGGKISLVTGDDSDAISFRGAAASQGGNISIETGDGNDQITSTGRLQAQGGEISLVTGDGSDAISFAGAVASRGGKISIETGNGDDQITFTSGLQASNGEISLVTGSGNDTISITGTISASNGGSVTIETGDGNDLIQLQGQVRAGALTIDAGEGTDTLVLISSGPQQFGQYYQNFLSDNGGIHGMGVENLIVAFYNNTRGISRLQGLADMVDATPNANLLLHIDSMGIRGGIGSRGRDINLSDLFDSGPDVFDKIIMSGSHNNTLAINGSLDSNNYAGSQLVILGDEKDTVKLSSDWIAGPNMGEYETFSNSGDVLVLQHQIQVLVG